MAKSLPINLHCDNKRDPGGPVVRTSPSNVGGVDSTPGQVTKILQASQQKKKKIQITRILSSFSIRGDNFKVSSVVIIPKCS